MLSSITPLGERGRGFSWGVTARPRSRPVRWPWARSAGAAARGRGVDRARREPGARSAGVGVRRRSRSPSTRRGCAAACPATRRQVNEDWLTRYRGWVYGVAFGVQLGTGVVTIVTSAAVYAAALGAVLCGTAAGGALVGAAFGATRALSLLPARQGTDPAGLVRLHDRLRAAPRRRRGARGAGGRGRRDRRSSWSGVCCEDRRSRPVGRCAAPDGRHGSCARPEEARRICTWPASRSSPTPGSSGPG